MHGVREQFVRWYFIFTESYSIGLLKPKQCDPVRPNGLYDMLVVNWKFAFDVQCSDLQPMSELYFNFLPVRSSPRCKYSALNEMHIPKYYLTVRTCGTGNKFDENYQSVQVCPGVVTIRFELLNILEFSSVINTSNTDEVISKTGWWIFFLINTHWHTHCCVCVVIYVCVCAWFKKKYFSLAHSFSALD